MQVKIILLNALFVTKSLLGTLKKIALICDLRIC